jgi:hypothetical protein
MLGAFISVAVLFGLFVLLPLLALKLLLGTVVWLVVLPFKILGGLFKLVFGLLGAVLGVAGALFGVVFSGVGILAAVILLPLLLLALPLLPLLLLGAFVWAVVKVLSPAAAAA